MKSVIMTVPVVYQAIAAKFKEALDIIAQVSFHTAPNTPAIAARKAKLEECEVRLFADGSQVPRQPSITRADGTVRMGDSTWTGISGQVGNLWELPDGTYSLYLLHRTYGGEVKWPITIANGQLVFDAAGPVITKWGSPAPATFQQVAGARRRFGSRRFRG